MKKKLIIWAVLIIYTLIIFLPPIIYGYIYPNNSDDTAFHLLYFESLRDGIAGESNYLGQAMVGYPLIWIGNLTSISLNTLFMWFNFIILWLVGISVFLLLNLIDYKMGLIGCFLAVFGIPTTLNMYDTGVIYDLATVGIIAPLFLFSVVKFFSTKKWRWLIPSILIFAFAIPFHSIVLKEIIGAKLVEPIPSFLEFAQTLIGYFVLLLFILAGFTVVSQKYQWDIKKKTLLIGLALLVVLLGVFSFTSLTSYPYRFALNLAVVFAILTAFLCGIIIQKKGLLILVLAVLVLTSFPMMTTYLGYNSAIKPLDKEVIAYVNSLDGEYFSCSPELAPWIYERFLNKKYKIGVLPYIERNQSMTYKTDKGVSWFWNAGKYKLGAEPTGKQLKYFEDGDLQIVVKIGK